MEVIEITDSPPPSPSPKTTDQPQGTGTVQPTAQQTTAQNNATTNSIIDEASAELAEDYQRITGLIKEANERLDDGDIQTRAINESLSYIQRHRNEGHHLFCHKLLYSVACYCLVLFSYEDGDAAGQWYKNLVKHDVERCKKCAIMYNRGRAKLVQQFASERNIEVEKLDIFSEKMLEWGRERVLETLRNEYQSYDSDSSNDIPPGLLLPVWECLYAPGLLRDEAEKKDGVISPIRAFFDEALQLLITKEYPSINKITVLNPGLLFLAIQGKHVESRWAFSCLNDLYDEMALLKSEQIHPEMKEEYWYRFKEMNNVGNRTDKDCEQSYRAILPFLKLFEREAILRVFLNPMKYKILTTQETNLFARVLEDIMITSDALPYVIRFLTFLLQRFGSQFWPAFAPYTWKNVIDNILKSPHLMGNFERLPDFELIPGDLNPGATSHDLLSWINPLINSLELAQQQQARNQIANHFISLVETRNNIPLPVKAILFKKACQLTSAGLTFKNTSYGSSFQNDLLLRFDTRGIVDSKLDRFSDYTLSRAIFFPEMNKSANDAIARAALDVICKALRYDILLLAQQTYDVKQGNSTTSCKYSPLVFENLVRQNLNVHKELAFRVLSSLELVSAIVPIEKNHQQHQSATIFLGLLKSFFVKFSDIDPHNSKLILANPKALKGYWSCVFSSDENVYQAAVDLLYDTFDSEGRLEGFHSLLDSNFIGCLNAVNDNVSTLIFNKFFEPCPRAVKVLTDVVSALNNPINGLFNTEIITNGENAAKDAVLRFWSHCWKFLNVIYVETVKWASTMTIDLVEFTRDTLDLSHAVLDCFKAIVNLERGTMDIKERENSLMEEIIATFTDMTVWLKLSDPGLLSSCVRLISSTLDLIFELKLNLDDKVVELLAKYASKSKKFSNKLTEQQVDVILTKARLFNSTLVDKIVTEAEEYRRSKMTPSPIPTTISSSPSPTPSALSVVSSRGGTPTAVQQRRGQMKLADFGSIIRPKQIIPQAKPVLPKSQLELARLELAKKKAQGPSRVIHAAREPGFNSRRRAKAVAGSGSDSESDSESDSGDEGKGTPSTRSLFGLKEKKETAPIILESAAEIQRRKQKEKLKEQENAKLRLNVDLNPLYDRILQWSFRRDDEYPDSEVKAAVREVSDSFKTSADYIRTYEPLLLLECWAGIQANKTRESDKPMACIIASKKSVNNYFEIFISLRKQDIVDYKFTESDLVVLATRVNDDVRPTNKEINESLTSCFGKIHEIKTVRGDNVDLTIRVTRSASLNVSLTPNMSILVMKLMQMTTIEREYSSLHGLEYYNLRDSILQAQPGEIPKLSKDKIKQIQTTYKVNESQANAIGCTLETSGFSLIQGPPGTGKTKTILGIIGYMLESFKQEKTSVISVPGVPNKLTPNDIRKGKKVLVCAPSNAAVDELVLRLKDGIMNVKGQKITPNVVRLGRSDAVNAAVKDRTLEELVDSRIGEPETRVSQMGPLREERAVIKKQLDELQLKIKDYPEDNDLYDKRRELRAKMNVINQKTDLERAKATSEYRNRDINRRRVQAEILEGAEIICSTLSGSAHEMVANLNITFDSVIIDEACQCTELSVVIPLRYGCKRCIMVGDPNQLPPTVLSTTASDFNYDQSLFVRMAKKFKPLLLNVQYRMNSAISTFPSLKFYDGELKDGEGIDEQTSRAWHSDPLFPPYRFYDIVEGHQSQNSKTMSYTNRAEVDIAIELVDTLFKKFPSSGFLNKIGVITPYKEQNRMLQNTFVRRFGQQIKQEISFNTIDGFQGQEKEIIIMSCVRADSTKAGVGFLRDFRRMNVALTRPKCSLWILGHHDSLVKNSLWYDLITDARKRNCLVEAKDGFTKNNSATLKLIQEGKSHVVDKGEVRDPRLPKPQQAPVKRTFNEYKKGNQDYSSSMFVKKQKQRGSYEHRGNNQNHDANQNLNRDDNFTDDFGTRNVPKEEPPKPKKISFSAYKSQQKKATEEEHSTPNGGSKPPSSFDLPKPTNQGSLPQPTRSTVLKPEVEPKKLNNPKKRKVAFEGPKEIRKETHFSADMYSEDQDQYSTPSSNSITSNIVNASSGIAGLNFVPLDPKAQSLPKATASDALVTSSKLPELPPLPPAPPKSSGLPALPAGPKPSQDIASPTTFGTGSASYPTSDLSRTRELPVPTNSTKLPNLQTGPGNQAPFNQHREAPIPYDDLGSRSSFSNKGGRNFGGDNFNNSSNFSNRNINQGSGNHNRGKNDNRNFNNHQHNRQSNFGHSNHNSGGFSKLQPTRSGTIPSDTVNQGQMNSASGQWRDNKMHGGGRGGYQGGRDNHNNRNRFNNNRR